MSDNLDPSIDQTSRPVILTRSIPERYDIVGQP